MILGVPHGTVAICPHDDEWLIQAYLMISRLERLVGCERTDIRHAGSTSVPHIAANPVIDIALGVKQERDIEEVCRALAEDGFIEDIGYVGFARVFCLEQDGLRTYQVFVVAVGSVGWRRLIVFRDNLNADYELAQTYADNNLCFSQLPFSEYLKSKNELVETVLLRASS